jgi:hypothetical protein
MDLDWPQMRTEPIGTSLFVSREFAACLALWSHHWCFLFVSSAFAEWLNKQWNWQLELASGATTVHVGP